MLTRGELVEQFEDACAVMAMALSPRPVETWSPAELQAMWSHSCRLARVDEQVTAVLLNRAPWPACFPADSRCLLISVLTDHAAIIAKFGTPT
jgi:hypothetical protein